MAKGKCNNPDCTVAETGICLESHSNVEECPNFIVNEDDQIGEAVVPQQNISNDTVQARPPLTTLTRQFHSGNEIGISDIFCVSQKRYTYFIGILGSTNAGKTCLLSSLYLLSSQRGLQPEYLFAGSYTLQGFEDRVRHLRTWEKGGLPDQFTEHTLLQDPRRPAFMHLCLKENKTFGKFKDLLLSDLPGEWTDQLIDNISATERFKFLKRADCIIYVIDGPLLDNIETKNNEIYKTKIALDRLSKHELINPVIPIVFVISKCDEIEMRIPDGIFEIMNHAKNHNLSASFVLTISFSKKPKKFESGLGVFDVIKHAFIPFSVQKGSKKAQGERSFWSI